MLFRLPYSRKDCLMAILTIVLVYAIYSILQSWYDMRQPTIETSPAPHFHDAIAPFHDEVFAYDKYVLLIPPKAPVPLCDHSDPQSFINVITISSVVHNALSHFGGTGHWFKYHNNLTSVYYIY